MGVRQSAAEYGSAISDQQITVAGTAVGLTRPTGAIAAMVTNGAEPVRVRWGTPTASVGHYLNLYEDDIADVKFIRVSSSSTIDVTYFG